MPARISPVLPSRLTNAASPCGGAVQADCSPVTNGSLFNCATRSVPTARASSLCAPASEVTAMIICLSPRPNLSDSSRDACHDSEVGSWKPPLARLLVTGIPKMAAPTITSSRDSDDSPRRGDGQCGDSVQHYSAFQLGPDLASSTLTTTDVFAVPGPGPKVVADMSAA